MSEEIVFSFDTGPNVYARVFNLTGQVWNTAGTPAFENWADGNVGDYDIAMTDKKSGQYIGDFPSTILFGRYKVNIYQRAGGSPAITDSVIGWGTILWNGTAEVFCASEDDVSNVLNIYNES